VGAFVWAARKGQFDDLTTPAMRVLHDDEKREEVDRNT
jgi:cbb3-type cytochrome oxidase maturation protein